MLVQSNEQSAIYKFRSGVVRAHEATIQVVPKADTEGRKGLDEFTSYNEQRSRVNESSTTPEEQQYVSSSDSVTTSKLTNGFMLRTPKHTKNTFPLQPRKYYPHNSS